MCSYVCMGTFSLKRLLYLSTITITTIIFITYTIDIEPIEVHTKKVSMLKRNNKHRGNRTEPSRKESYTYHVQLYIQIDSYIVIMYWRWKPLKHLRIMSNAAKYKCTHSHTSMKWFRILSKTGPFRSMENPIKRNEKQSTRSSINQTYAHQIERWHRAKWNTKIPMHIL